MKRLLGVSSVLAFALPFNAASAACKPDDVRYYLSAGFSHEQVISLCASGAAQQQPGAPSAAPQAAPATRYSEPAAQQQSQGRYYNRDEETLKTSLVAHDIKLDASKLQFTEKVCIKYGTPDAVADFKNQVCPFVVFEVQRRGLRVEDVNEGLWGLTEASIIISGDVKRTIEGLEKYKAKDRPLIQAELGNSNQLKLVVRKGVPPYSVSEALKNISM